MPARWLRDGSSIAFTAFASLAGFTAYFSMYAFRKPFTAASFDHVDGWHYALDFKIALVLAQLVGYAASKFIGIKVISGMQRGYRAQAILGLIGASWLALIVFAVVPAIFKVPAMFFNGLCLGMIWGLVFSYMEGRRTSRNSGRGALREFHRFLRRGEIGRHIAHPARACAGVLDAGRHGPVVRAPAVAIRMGPHLAAASQCRRRSGAGSPGADARARDPRFSPRLRPGHRASGDDLCVCHRSARFPRQFRGGAVDRPWIYQPGVGVHCDGAGGCGCGIGRDGCRRQSAEQHPRAGRHPRPDTGRPGAAGRIDLGIRRRMAGSASLDDRERCRPLRCLHAVQCHAVRSHGCGQRPGGKCRVSDLRRRRRRLCRQLRLIVVAQFRNAACRVAGGIPVGGVRDDRDWLGSCDAVAVLLQRPLSRGPSPCRRFPVPDQRIRARAVPVRHALPPAVRSSGR